MTPPLRVCLFGSPSVEGPAEAVALLEQPRRLALFAMLALVRPGGLVRRDQLTVTFWPEHDAVHARAALRKAMHALGQVIGGAAVRGRGEEQLGLDPDHVWVDAVAFRQALQEGRVDDACALYQGPLLEGLAVDAPAFDQWLSAERRALHEEAARAAWRLATAAEEAQQISLATRRARAAARLAVPDERAIRNAMKMLARAGDRAGALALYEECAQRLRHELDVEPSTETRALAVELRGR